LLLIANRPVLSRLPRQSRKPGVYVPSLRRK
jgi:hypothetical protein